MSTYQIGNNVVVTFNMSANRDDLQSLDHLKHSKSFFYQVATNDSPHGVTMQFKACLPFILWQIKKRKSTQTTQNLPLCFSAPAGLLSLK